MAVNPLVLDRMLEELAWANKRRVEAQQRADMHHAHAADALEEVVHQEYIAGEIRTAVRALAPNVPLDL